MTTERILARTNGVYAGVPIVTRYMRERTISLLGGLVNSSERDTRLKALYARAFFWMESLEKLANPHDYQAIVTCNRSLFELAIDLVLLSQGGQYTPDKMYWWEQSAKLKAAESLVRFYTQRGSSVPDAHNSSVNFIRNKKTTIETQRQALWNTNKHPPRWTGSSDMSVDAKEADNFRRDEILEDFGTTLQEFYETQMRRMHLSVHGSGLALERYLDSQGFYIVCGLGYKWSTDLAMFCTKLILTDFGFSNHLPELKSEWQQIKNQREQVEAQYGSNEDQSIDEDSSN